MRTFTATLALPAVGLLVLTACGGDTETAGETPDETPDAASDDADEPADDEEEVTVTFWHTYNPDSGEYDVFVDEVLPLFESEHPNITIDEVNQPYEGLHDALVTAVAGGNAPDLMRMDIIWVPEFADLGALEPVDGYDGFDEIRQSVFTGPMETTHVNGSYFGLPLNTNTQVMIYRQDALDAAGMDEPPATVEQFETFLDATSVGEVNGHAVSSSYPWNLFPWFWTLGGRATNDDHTVADGYINSPESVAAVEKLNEWLGAGALASTMIGTEPGTWDGFTSGQYASILDGPWTFPSLGGELGDQMVGATIPEGPGGSVSVVGGEDIVMFNRSEVKDAAWEFMHFMVSKEAQEIMAQTGIIPVHQDATGAVLAQGAYHSFYIEQLESAQPRTPVATWARIDDILGTAFESVFRGKSDAQSALDRAATQIDEQLGQ